MDETSDPRIFAMGEIPQTQNDQEFKQKRFWSVQKDINNTISVCTSTFLLDENTWQKNNNDKPNITLLASINTKNGLPQNTQQRIINSLFDNKIFPTIKECTDEVKKKWSQLITNFRATQTFKDDIKKHFQQKNIDYLECADDFLEEQPMWYDPAGIWWVYNQETRTWSMTDETNIMNLIDEAGILEQTTKNDVQGQILRALQRRSRINAPKPMPQTWVQFDNIIIDIETMQEQSATSEYFTTNPIPWKLGTSDQTPIMDKLFEEWVGKNNVPLLQEIMAFCCAPSYFMQRIFCFVGSGSNGKSKYMQIVCKFVGESNVASSSIYQILQNRFESSNLYKKLVCQMGETDFEDIKNTEMLKRLCSGTDRIGFEFKGKNCFSDINYAKLLIATNTLPISHDTTDGWYRRWMIIEFNKKFTEKKDVFAMITDEEYENFARKTIKILNKLWKDREFTNEGSIEDRKRKYEEKSNPLKQFIQEKTIRSPNGNIFCFEFRDMFNRFCQERGLRNWSERSIGLFMKEEGLDRIKISSGEKSQVSGESVRYWAYSGLDWMPKKSEGQMSIFGSLNNANVPHVPEDLLVTSRDSIQSFRVESVVQAGQPALNNVNNGLLYKQNVLNVVKSLCGEFVPMPLNIVNQPRHKLSSHVCILDILGTSVRDNTLIYVQDTENLGFEPKKLGTREENLGTRQNDIKNQLTKFLKTCQISYQKTTQKTMQTLQQKKQLVTYEEVLQQFDETLHPLVEQNIKLLINEGELFEPEPGKIAAL